jgi:predicted alpha/beta-hydrolase family hydrolase
MAQEFQSGVEQAADAFDQSWLHIGVIGFILMSMQEEMRFAVENADEVSAILQQPEEARFMLVLAHGAGAGMTHPFMTALAGELERLGLATLRYQFPYMQQRRRAPDSPAVLTATVAAAVQAAGRAVPGLPLLAGGKSMGGRMTSTAAAERKIEDVRGIVFFGFPLHPPSRPGMKRAEHLKNVSAPMLFLQGTRDDLADLNLLRPICSELGARATLRVIDGADHSFHMLKKSGKTDAEVLRGLAETTVKWADKIKL